MAEGLNLSSLLRFAEQCDDAAAGLVRFRQDLPRHAPKVTALISELFAISSVLRQLHKDNRSYGPSSTRANNELALVLQSLNITLDNGIFVMFASEQPPQVAWEDLNYRFESVEGFDFLERLEIYRDILDALALSFFDRTEVPRELKQDLRHLLETQQEAQRRSRSFVSGSTTPRPRMRRVNTPVSPTVISDEWETFDPVDPPRFTGAPDAPISPTYTSGSSPTMGSSQTSYGSDPYVQVPSGSLTHWAQNVFNGTNPFNPYQQPGSQLDDRSSCYGTVESDALHNLVRDRFQRVLELPFDEERFWLRLYWRPTDNRARILIITKDSYGHKLLHCVPLTSLKVIRNKSTLQLCRCSRGDRRYSLWARLNFVFHERMVLFYSTFVAMKRQDEQQVSHRDLVDHFELENEAYGEQELFAGRIKHGNMFHALRLFRDSSSSVIRLEASACRGSRKDVPIWTAFVTKYGFDPDWPQYEGQGLVSLIAIKPPPFVFLSRYEPPMNQARNYVLPFTSKQDAEEFMGVWANLCRTHGRNL